MHRAHTSRHGGGRSRFGKRTNTKRRTQARGGRRSKFQSKVISHDKFINKNPVTHTTTAYVPTHTFDDFKLDAAITANLKRRGYLQPTHVQDEAIPHILDGRDLIGLANTGSGKTAAFVLPIIHRLTTKREPVLIMAPTRELALQIQDEFRAFANGMRIRATLCVGGLNIRKQIRDLREHPDIVIGTPGRLKDLIERNVLKLGNTTTLVLDEVDHMLDMGFLPDITFIINKLPQKRQSLCFSATLTPTISKLLDQRLVNPVTISVRTSETGEHIAQDIIRVRNQEEKLTQLSQMLSQDHFEKVLIFGQMKHSVQKLSDTLNKLNFPAIAIHGNKSQPQRQKALNSFKSGKVKIMVATDVAARGLDIPNVSHVINFDQPSTHEEYVHRIGRTGRAGKQGQAYTFVQ